MRRCPAFEQTIVRNRLPSFYLRPRVVKDLVELCRHSPLYFTLTGSASLVQMDMVGVSTCTQFQGANRAIRPLRSKLKNLVPKGGLEPPHPCEYMDLNHARLPIPPLRHGVLRSTVKSEHANRDTPSLTNTASAVNSRDAPAVVHASLSLDVFWGISQTVGQTSARKERLLGER